MAKTVQDQIEKAKVLINALPYMQKFRDKTIVIKYGGHAMVDDHLKRQFALDVILLKQIGINPIIVHGGGPQINRLLERLDIKPSYVEGMRVTDGETMDVVEMVLVGKVNKQIVGLINHCGGKAVGLSGRDGDLVCAEKLKVSSTRIREAVKDSPPELIDLGRVGRVTRVNTAVLESLYLKDFIPVIAPVGVGEDGQAFNINADLVAGAIAGALSAEKLMLLTDVEGVKDKNGELITFLPHQELESLVADGTVAGGMIPKVRCCVDALQSGVAKTYILDGRVEHSILLEIFTKEGVGTEIY
ncbi:acetylglutamate kinase [Desulforhopalus singaporensis]|uniref:Acetylglutamate kinase n=1 Tax=Desulforhopalus singaporensis TaxID=91360 RepID=A0A1H0TUM5_9BACT|nr:acetylglutamate kinase [Desulforhopalus singaporensis]SDP57368.1 N-acetylglutamate kinase [Desulforhopalus singaporensis]